MFRKRIYAGDQPDDMGEVLLYLLLTNKEKLMRDVKQPWPQWQLKILWEETSIRITAQNLRRAHFVWRIFLTRSPPLESKGAQDNLLEHS